jgi:hypothetical protein
MKKMIAIIAIAAITVTAASAGSTELLQKKFDAAVAAADWKTAETISAVMANMATAVNQKQQAELE